MLNSVTLIGRLVADPELRYTQTKLPVTTIRIAVDRDYLSSGTRETDFFDVVAWRGTAEFLSRYFSKGRMAVVEGSLQLRDWTARDGTKRRTAEVIVSSIYFGDSKRDSERPADTHSGYEEMESTDNDGDLPF